MSGREAEYARRKREFFSRDFLDWSRSDAEDVLVSLARNLGRVLLFDRGIAFARIRDAFLVVSDKDAQLVAQIRPVPATKVQRRAATSGELFIDWQIAEDAGQRIGHGFDGYKAGALRAKRRHDEDVGIGEERGRIGLVSRKAHRHAVQLR